VLKIEINTALSVLSYIQSGTNNLRKVMLKTDMFISLRSNDVTEGHNLIFY